MENSSEDTFLPLDGIENGPEANIVTVRAVVLGLLCGTLVNISNVYLGLKSGWMSSANILGSIVGFVVLKKWAASTDLPFGPHENNIVQTVATASGGMSATFVSAIPAMYQLGLLETPLRDFLRIIIFTAVGGYFGLLSVVLLRPFFIHTAARDLKLIFPTATATAVTIRNMHTATSGVEGAGRRMRYAGLAFIAAFLLSVTSQYMPGMLLGWHIFTWLSAWSVAAPFALAAETWGWFLEFSPAMIGTGMLISPSVACSFLGGSVLAWGVIGPYLTSHGLAFGQPVSNDPQWSGLMFYGSMSKDFANAEHPSPRYWLLWPGVACMLSVAFLELACHWRAFLKLAQTSLTTMTTYLQSALGRTQYDYTRLEPVDDEEQGTSKQSGHEQTISPVVCISSLSVLVVVASALTHTQFGMSVLETLVALLLAFLMSLVTIQATGATDMNPTTSVSKVSQLAVGAIAQTSGSSVRHTELVNLLGGALTSMGANHSTDLMSDFRVGFLLKTPPRPQFVAQLLGTLGATLVTPLVFLMFTTAYPCIINATEARCEFVAPAIASWRAVAVAASEPVRPIPASSLTFSLVFATIGCIITLIKNVLMRHKWAGARAYMPNMTMIALAFTLPAPQYGVTLVMGTAVAWLWHRRHGESFENLGVATAAGLVAGEGIGGIANCALSLLGVGGNRWRLTIGCPAGQC